MIDIAFIPQLKTAIQNVIDSFTLHVTSSEAFKDEVIANAGGVVPMFLWEYHTRMDAFRHKINIFDAFLYEGVPYGYAQNVTGSINLLTQTQSTITGTSEDYFTDTVPRGTTSTLNIGLLKEVFIAQPEMGNANFQTFGDTLFVGIRNMAYFIKDGVLVRGIKFDEPYFPSYTEIGTITGAGTAIATTEKAQRDTTAYFPSVYSTSFCKTFYSAPYCYVVYRDRTVKYHVDA